MKSHDFPVPQAYVDHQIENNVRRSVREITGRDMDPRSLNLDWNKLREQQGERATQDVKASLIIERLRTPSRFTQRMKRWIANCSASQRPNVRRWQRYGCDSRRTGRLGSDCVADSDGKDLEFPV